MGGASRREFVDHVRVFRSRVEASLIETRNIGFCMTVALSYGAEQGFAQLVMSLFVGSYPIEDEPLEPKDRCLYYNS